MPGPLDYLLPPPMPGLLQLGTGQPPPFSPSEPNWGEQRDPFAFGAPRPPPAGDVVLPTARPGFADTMPRIPRSIHRNDARLFGGDFIPAADQQYVRPGEHIYNTPLEPEQERAFRDWVQQNKVPFDPNAGMTDYDMRGFWRGIQTGDPHAQTEINKNDERVHYNDWWKTPLHQSFSRGSQWATPDAPYWANDQQLVDKDGNVLFDERPR